MAFYQTNKISSFNCIGQWIIVITQTKEMSFFNYAWTLNNGDSIKQTNYHLLIVAGQWIIGVMPNKRNITYSLYMDSV